MPRTTTANMDAHLAQTVTTLATIWKIVRQDDVTLLFTDHDQDITFDSEVYESEDGYDRSDIISRDDGSPDNFSVKGPITVGGVTIEDIQELRFDGAIIEISIVNWQDTSASMGRIIYQTGEVGEIRSERVGEYELEARGLTQRFARRVGAVIGLSCRADLFDSRCSNPLDPNSVQKVDFEIIGEVSAVADRRSFTVENESLGAADLDLSTGGGNSITQVSDGSIVYDPTAIDGTEAYPFEVGTADALQLLDANTNAGEFYIQTADIDLSTVSGGTWQQIASMEATYDGQGFRIHTYSGTMSGSLGGGVFEGITSTGTVKNLMLEDLDFEEAINQRSGVLAGQCSGATILNILAINCSWQIDASSITLALGGLIGECITSCTVQNCYSDVTFIDNSTTNFSPIEGVIGRDDISGTFAGLYYNADVFTLVPTLQEESLTVPVTALEEWQAKARFTFDEFDFRQVFKHPVTVGSTNIPVTIDQDAGTITRSAGNWTSDGFVAAQTLELQDSVSKAGFVSKIAAGGVTATILTIDDGTLPDEDITIVTARAGTLDIDMIEKGLTDGVQQLEIRHPDALRGDFVSGTLAWTEVTPGSSTVAVEVSKDLDSYSSQTSGAALVGFSGSESLLGDYLGIRIILTPDGSNYPTVEDMILTFLTDAKPLGARDELFKYGTVKWTSGANINRQMEIKSSDEASGVITLFLRMNADISVGDEFTMVPGCPKDLFSCTRTFRNTLNFRGEPYTPGQDHLLQIHTAQSGSGADVTLGNAKAHLPRDLDVTV